MIKQRMAILGPAIVLMVAMGIVAILVPDLLKVLIIGIFIVMVVALGIVLILERSRRERGR